MLSTRTRSPVLNRGVIGSPFVEAREEIGEFGRMAHSPFIDAMLACETLPCPALPCPVVEFVGVNRRVLRKALCQLQIGAATDASILAAVRDDGSGEIRARILVSVLGQGCSARILLAFSPNRSLTLPSANCSSNGG
jgi:hypothetical protein